MIVPSSFESVTGKRPAAFVAASALILVLSGCAVSNGSFLPDSASVEAHWTKVREPYGDIPEIQHGAPDAWLLVYLDYYRVIDDGDGIFGFLSPGHSHNVSVERHSPDCVGPVASSGLKICRTIDWFLILGGYQIFDSHPASVCSFSVDVNSNAPAIPSDDTTAVGVALPEPLETGYCGIPVKANDELHVKYLIFDADILSGNDTCTRTDVYRKGNNWGVGHHLSECRAKVKGNLYYRIFELQ